MTLCEKLYVFKKRLLNFVVRNSQIGNKGQLFCVWYIKKGIKKCWGLTQHLFVIE